MSRETKIILYAVGMILVALASGVYIIPMPIAIFINFVLGCFLGTELAELWWSK